MFLFTSVFVLKMQKIIKLTGFLMVVNENYDCYFHETSKKVPQAAALHTTDGIISIHDVSNNILSCDS